MIKIEETAVSFLKFQQDGFTRKSMDLSKDNLVLHCPRTQLIAGEIKSGTALG
jgi:hypothetical protein